MSMMYNATAGLTSSQTALNVTSQNISNSAVPEYSRQEVVYGTSPTGTVYVSDVQRVSDDFMTSQVWESASDYGYSLSYGSQAVLLENTFTSDSTSLSPSLNEFYGSLNDAAADPADVANRQQVLNSADYLANSFNTLQSQMDAQYQQINDQLFAMVEEVNGTLTALADLNEAIAETSSQPGGVPNNLLDERDQLIQQMSELIDVEADIQDDETVNLYLPTGELLVMGGEANSLEMVPGDPDNSSFQLVLDTGTSKKPVTGVGGSVQGLLEFRDEQLEPAMRELGRLALVTVDSINSELEKGYDLNGNPGQPLFSDINADTGNRSAPYSDNQGDAVLDVTIEDTAQLEASDYRVDFIENPESGEVEYQVTRGTDGEIVASGTDMPIEFDGVSVTVTEGDFEAGDSFSVEPTKNFAGSVDMTLTDPEALAFSSDPEASGNNDVLNNLIDLKDEPLVEGEYSINEAWSMMVSDVVGTSAGAQSRYEASAQLYMHAQNQDLSVRGVNMDEEAINLIVFQQSYQANAKVIAASQEMLDTILAL